MTPQTIRTKSRQSLSESNVDVVYRYSGKSSLVINDTIQVEASRGTSISTEEARFIKVIILPYIISSLTNDKVCLTAPKSQPRSNQNVYRISNKKKKASTPSPLSFRIHPKTTAFFLTLLTQTSLAPAGGSPVHPPSQLRIVLVSLSVYVLVAGRLVGQFVTVGAQLVMVLVFVTTMVEKPVLVICPLVCGATGVAVGGGGDAQPPLQL